MQLIVRHATGIHLAANPLQESKGDPTLQCKKKINRVLGIILSGRNMAAVVVIVSLTVSAINKMLF